MASQFIIYSSSDASGPGQLTGQAGTLLALLDACLVNGYTGKAAAGWSKPFANSGNIGCYKNGTGSTQMSLLINDNGPNVTSTFKEAWATGWESIASIAAPVGTGSGQFPTPAQLLTTGHVVCRKSASADGVGRNWIMFADAHTFYLFVLTGDTANTYYNLIFGDIYSMKGSTDAYRAFIFGKTVENNATGDGWDVYTVVVASGIMSAAAGGHFMARTWGGGGGSITVSKTWDFSMAVGTAPGGGQDSFFLAGSAQTPNGPDNCLYLSPLRICENSVSSIRGRLRGVYFVGHNVASFSDGQTFAGANDYAGKSFQIVKVGGSNGFWAMETSATVETN